MAGLKRIEGYDEEVINICPNDTDGEILEVGDLYIQLPKTPKRRISSTTKSLNQCKCGIDLTCGRIATDSFYG